MSQSELKAANRIFLDAFKHVKSHKIRRIIVTDRVCENIIVKQTDGVPPIRHTGGTYLASIIEELDKDRVKPSVVILITDGFDMHDSMEKMARWKHVSKLRTILVRNPNGTYPGINFHCDEIE
jgi:predicted metal-dependent peptidase